MPRVRAPSAASITVADAKLGACERGRTSPDEVFIEGARAPKARREDFQGRGRGHRWLGREAALLADRDQRGRVSEGIEMNCVITGCPNEGRRNLSVRLRRPNTSAIWAPNMDGFLCDEHATGGVRRNHS
jgi:hypothetical protein